MRRALVEAGVLDEVFLALVRHGATVVPVKVVKVGVIIMSLCAGVCCATWVVIPRRTLKGMKLKKWKAG